jgi:hypothetical protein
MKISLKSRVAPALMSTALLMSCQAEDISIDLLKVVPIDMTSCDTNGTDKGPPLTSGAFDLVMGSSYSINIATQNALVNIVAAKEFEDVDGRLNTNNINLTKLTVEYVDVDGVDLGLDPVVDIPLTGQLSTDSTEPLVIPNIVIFDQQMTEILEQNGVLKGTGLSGPVAVRGSFTVILRLTLFGETIDGRSAQSNQISFPVEVCTGCLVRGGVGGVCEDRPFTDDEAESLSLCPNGIGKDGEFASCLVCQELAKPELAQLCTP